jgi:hypothetical protein
MLIENWWTSGSVVEKKLLIVEERNWRPSFYTQVCKPDAKNLIADSLGSERKPNFPEAETSGKPKSSVCCSQLPLHL